MIDLNLELDYRKEPYQLVRNSKIYILDEKGLEDYYSKNHITHKFLSKFHPKIIEHINKMSASSIPQKGDTIIVKKHSLNKNLPDIKIEKKLNLNS